MVNSTDILPCPCCGGKALHYYCTSSGHNLWGNKTFMAGEKVDHSIVKCLKCGLQTKVYSTENGAVNSWNRRTANGTDKHET